MRSRPSPIRNIPPLSSPARRRIVSTNPMSRPWRHLLLVLLLVATTVEARTRVRRPPPPPPQDVFSYANSHEVWTEHLSLDLQVDFAAERIRGTATHNIVNRYGAREMVLDTRALIIRRVTVDGATAQFVHAGEEANGRALRIPITPTTRTVSVEYETSPGSTALRWIEPTQTMGRTKPALVTQGQPDYARTWIPVQDSPAVRMTWDATVRVTDGLLALMSARNPQQVRDDGVYTFEQRRSVPAYLIVLAAGPLVFRPLDERSGIYAEPELIDDAVYEMQHVPQMMEVAEELLGPYPFDRYDLLFAPHFGGGMENPELNFITPAHITRNDPDPVLPSGLIAHELAHSWVGDMVTCATWSDTWLNEGFATYYEKRILEVMSGEERAEVGFFFDRSAYQSFLQNDPPSRLSTLHRTFTGNERPFNAFNVVAYQKGELFLKMLEDRLGRTAFDSMIDGYLRRHAWSWVDDRAFLRALAEELESQPAGLAESLMLNQWLYEGGLPSNVTAPTSSRIWDRVAIVSSAYRQGTPAAQLNRSNWTVLEENLFLQQIADLVPSRLAELDAAFGFSGRHNPPIIWLNGIARTLNPALLPLLESYLMRGDSSALAIWYVLGETSQGRSYGIPIFQRARPYYSDDSRFIIESYLRLRNKTEEPVEPAFVKRAA
jgi:leukotriene-A4 hydrolase